MLSAKPWAIDGTLLTTAAEKASDAAFCSFRLSRISGLIRSASNMGFLAMMVLIELWTIDTRVAVSPDISMASLNVRLAEASAICVPVMMSKMRTPEAVMSAVTSAKPAGPGGKFSTTLLSARVALAINSKAPMMDASDARTVLANREIGMRLRRILMVI